MIAEWSPEWLPWRGSSALSSRWWRSGDGLVGGKVEGGCFGEGSGEGSLYGGFMGFLVKWEEREEEKGNGEVV